MTLEKGIKIPIKDAIVSFSFICGTCGEEVTLERDIYSLAFDRFRWPKNCPHCESNFRGAFNINHEKAYVTIITHAKRTEETQ